MKGMKDLIYLDWASTSPICDAAKSAIIEHIDDFGNPSSVHEIGRQARMLIENARERIARCINAEPEEIFFTSGGSESNTWVVSNFPCIASNIEHHSIDGDYTFQVELGTGLAPINVYRQVNRWITDMVSCAYVNNEIGIIQPIKEIAEAVHDRKMWFHTDAVQALPYLKVDVKDINCDMLSASGHKVGALKGTGFLYVKKNGPELERLIVGGKQESGLRPGTENVLGILSFAAALEDAVQHMERRNKHIKHLRDKLLERLLEVPGAYLNGSLEHRVSGNINIRFDGVSGARLVALCSLYGVYISSGSACNEGVSMPSHVLRAIGLSDEEALSSVRITIGHTNTEEEIDTAANIITKLIERMRHED